MKNIKHFKSFLCTTFILASYNLINPAPVFASQNGLFYLTGDIGGFAPNNKTMKTPDQIEIGDDTFYTSERNISNKENIGLEPRFWHKSYRESRTC